jgi:enoyl-CoA hydratase/carnithine racemase
LLNFVADEAQIQERVNAYAASVAANAPLTVHAAKAAVQTFERYADAVNTPEVAALVARCFDSDDYKEGRQAFLAKRLPQFKGL